MNNTTKKYGFIAILAVLVVAIIGLSIYFATKAPTPEEANAGAQIVDKKEDEEGVIVINDVNDGKLTIPQYNIPLNTYSVDKFTENNGIISYEDGSTLGINVNPRKEAIDWEQTDWNLVKESVDFVMIRVGNRGGVRGDLYVDDTFQTCIEGAIEAGLDVGVYFYSQAISDVEADQEATFVLEKIKSYQIKYPVAFVWEYGSEEELNGTPRTANSMPSEITSFANVFCKKVKKAGYTPSVYMNKDMGYDVYDLEQLKDYDIWYSEYKKTPAFYYDFGMWQYSNEGTVPGIDGKVKMNVALKPYG